MKTIDFNKKVILQDGQEHQSETLRDVLKAGILAGAPTPNGAPDILKIGGWWKTLCSGEPLVLDEADEKKLEDVIVTSERAAPFIKIQLLDALKSQGPHPKDNPVHPKKP